MLFINKKQVTADEICKKFGVSTAQLAKIRKHSMFTIHPSKTKIDLGSKTKRSGVGIAFLSYFSIRTADGESLEIRYAASVMPQILENGTAITKYSPDLVEFAGELDQKLDPDEAVFFYLSPLNQFSPFREQGLIDAASLPHFAYDDKQLIAQKEMAKVDSLYEALNHAKTINTEDLNIFAKGMDVGSVDGMDELEIRAELAKLATSNPDYYLSKKNMQVTRYEGIIRDAIDKGVFMVLDTFGNKRWVWNVGSRKGQTVVEIQNATVGESEILFNFLKEKIQDYYSILLNIHNEINANSKAEAFLRKTATPAMAETTGRYPENIIETMDPYSRENEVWNRNANIEYDDEKDTNEPISDEPLPLPTDFNSAKEYLKQRLNTGKYPSPKQASEFLKALNIGKDEEKAFKEAFA